jgi:protein-disulfide isomerase
MRHLSLVSLGAALAIAALPLPAFAFDIAKMSQDERAAFQAEIRAYLLENPEILTEVAALLESREAEVQAQGDAALVTAHATALFEDPNAWVGGNPEGDITLVKFIDYRCGYCRKANAEVAELVKSDGNIRFILKEYPILGPESDLSSRFALAVRQAGGDSAYAAAHDALITFRGEVNEASLTALAEELGLDPAKVLALMSSEAVSRIIDANHALGQDMAINGTPTFVIGGQMLRGYVPLGAMQQIVAAERQG